MNPVCQFARSTVSRVIERNTIQVRPSICVFCQHRLPKRTTASRRAFSTSPNSKYAAPLRPTEGRVQDDVVALDSSSPAKPASVVDDLNVEDFRDDSQAREDAKLYQEGLRRQEKVARQRQIIDAPLHHEYVPATSWEGLETVGGEREWDTGRKFKNFLSPAKLESTEKITVAIYRAVVEVFAALGGGRTPRTSINYEVGALRGEATQVRIDFDQASDPGLGGKVKITYPNAAVERAVRKAGSPLANVPVGILVDEPVLQDPAADESGGDEILSSQASQIESSVAAAAAASAIPAAQTGDLTALIKSWGRSWLHIPLTDPKVKFAVTKRITRITGTPVPDHVAHKADSVTWLIKELPKPQNPPKLFEELTASGALAKLANVSVKGRRQTPIDKEIQLGRWKLIEAELTRRGLPVVGRG